MSTGICSRSSTVGPISTGDTALLARMGDSAKKIASVAACWVPKIDKLLARDGFYATPETTGR